MTTLFDAVKAGDVNAVRECIASGAEVNERREDGETALMFEAESGNSDIVKYLIEKGANVNAMEAENEYTAARFAEINGHDDIAVFPERA